MSHQKQLESAFRKTLTLRGSDATIDGQAFKFIRGQFVSELQGDDLVEASGLHITDSENTFSTSTLRSLFPSSLIGANSRVTFSNGKILSCQSDNSKYTVEAINDNPESVWIKLYLREV